jgi:hypothetical protein
MSTFAILALVGIGGAVVWYIGVLVFGHREHVPPTADLSPRMPARPASPVVRRPSESSSRSTPLRSPPSRSSASTDTTSSAADDLLTYLVIHDAMTHHDSTSYDAGAHHDSGSDYSSSGDSSCGSSGGDSSCGSCGGD